MTDPHDAHEARSHLTVPSFTTPDTQRAIDFLGAVERIRVGGEHTAGELAVHDVEATRGHGSPMHRHALATETFFVLDGTLRVVVDDEEAVADAGSVAVLPPRRTHGFVVVSPRARYLTIHTPAGFDAFVEAAGAPAGHPAGPSDPDTLTRLAAEHGIEIVGPPPLP